MPVEYDTADDLGQDYREPGPIAAPTSIEPVDVTPIAAPGRVPVAAPRSPFLTPEEAEQRTVMRRLQYGVADLPLAEAEQAVTTALKFQAIRGYQQDLAKGVSAVDALTKWAPIMFSQPKAATMGQAASLVRAMRPEDKYMDIGGVGYQMKGGRAYRITPPKTVPEKPIPLVLPADPENPLAGGHVTIPLAKDDPLVQKALKRAREGTPEAPPEETGIVSRIKTAIFGKPSAPTAAPTAPPVVAPAAPAAPVVAPPAAATGVPMPAAAKPVTPQQKLDAARALRKQHPDWTKQQILDAVNQ